VGVSHRLFANMNLTADPCEDFDEFACGRFHREMSIPEDKGSFGAFTPLETTIYERGRALLEEDDKDGDWEVFKLSKKHYRSCMDIDKLEEVGVKPMEDRIKLFGGWPVLMGEEEWSGSNENYKWYDQIYKFKDNGFGKNFIVYVSVATDDGDSSKRYS
jgi:membrane metallo-endopeptidase-like protein 1